MSDINLKFDGEQVVSYVGGKPRVAGTDPDIVEAVTRERLKQAGLDEWQAIMDDVKAGKYGDWDDLRERAVEYILADPMQEGQGIGSSDINHTVVGLIRSGEIRPNDAGLQELGEGYDEVEEALEGDSDPRIEKKRNDAAAAHHEMMQGRETKTGKCRACNGEGYCMGGKCPYCNGSGEEGQGDTDGKGFGEMESSRHIASKNARTSGQLMMTNKWIVTPSGLKGQILGSSSGLWADEVTVRLENGRIAHYTVGDGIRMAEEETSERPTPIEGLRKRIAADYNIDKDSLIERRRELDGIVREVGDLVAQSSMEDATALDEIRVVADYERNEIDEAIAQIEQDEAEEFTPHGMEATEQGDMGHHGGVVDAAYDEMMRQADEQDFQQLIDEGPEVFVVDLDESTLYDATAVRAAAQDYVRERTAGVEVDARDEFEKTFLSRVEQLRQQATTEHKKTTKKEASKQEDLYGDLPDEMLFS